MSWDNTHLISRADNNIYKLLVSIDAKLGTKIDEQLFACIGESLREDLVKVRMYFSGL